MLEFDFVGIVLRWMHIFAAIALVGGLLFQRFVLLPAALPLEESLRKELCERSSRRWSKIVMVSAFFLLVSGLVNFIFTMQLFKGADLPIPKMYHLLFGIKFLLALVIFFLASALAGRGKGTQKFRDHAARWLNVSLVLATLVVAISGILRTTHVAPNALEMDRAMIPSNEVPSNEVPSNEVPSEETPSKEL